MASNAGNDDIILLFSAREYNKSRDVSKIMQGVVAKNSQKHVRGVDKECKRLAIKCGALSEKKFALRR
jgi:hypothetical protein